MATPWAAALCLALAAPLLLPGCLVARGECSGDLVVQVLYTETSYKEKSTPPPFSAANVTLFKPEGGPSLAAKMASSTGCVAFSGFPPGSYRVSSRVQIPTTHCDWEGYDGVASVELPRDRPLILELDHGCIVT